VSAAPPQEQTAPPRRDEQARRLVRRQLVLTAATLATVLVALALVRSHAIEGAHYARVVSDGQARIRIVHDRPAPLVVRLAVAELVLCGALVLVAVVHAARVIAFVFPREVS
jgi:hypothetical protein